jgi:hypothetical protein
MKAGLAALAAASALIFAGVALAATPAQYRQQATAICHTTTAKLKKLATPASPKDFGLYLKQATPIFEAQYKALRKVTAPPALKFLHGKALAAEQGQLVGIKAMIARLDSGADPTKTFNAFDKRLSGLSNAEDAAWTKLHVLACKSVGS